MQGCLELLLLILSHRDVFQGLQPLDGQGRLAMQRSKGITRRGSAWLRTERLARRAGCRRDRRRVPRLRPAQGTPVTQDRLGGHRSPGPWPGVCSRSQRLLRRTLAFEMGKAAAGCGGAAGVRRASLFGSLCPSRERIPGWCLPPPCPSPLRSH